MRTILVGWAFLFLGAVAHADTLLLRDGRALVGPRVVRTPNGVTIHLGPGAIHVPASQVLARYDEDDPGAALQLRAHRKHRRWRSRYRESVGPYRFETTMTPAVFALYRGRMLAFHRALLAELDVELAPDTAATVCLYATQGDFHAISGVAGGVMAVHLYLQNEIAGFDDPAQRASRLHAIQWAQSSLLLRKAFPALARDRRLYGALIDYYAAAEPSAADPATFTFGLLEGGLWETLHHGKLDADGAAGGGSLAGGRWERDAWAWGALHRHMQDESWKRNLLEGLRAASPEGEDDLGLLPTPEAKAEQRKVRAMVLEHLAGLEPTRSVELVAAGRVAEHRHQTVRALALYTQAVRVAPDDPEPHLARARLLDAESWPTPRAEERLAAWQAALDLVPLSLEARERYAFCLGRLGREVESDEQMALVGALREALQPR